ncbi:unnamed protein product [Litomosoides sigmodontis]|uniref:Uncharacterized protein n=1 Tax=Litomosoides sigmodontis TaxID=42156 RepID=A0A3P6T6M0_LITSI|nr:unnamed protein product [Litomosoides sigmodontis]
MKLSTGRLRAFCRQRDLAHRSHCAMSAESLYAAVNEVLKRLVAEAIAVDKCAKIVHKTTKKKIASTKMEEILTTAKDELQESVLNGVSQVIHNDEVLEGMVNLKNLIEESPKDVKGWRPSGIPSDDISGHLQPVMFDIEENLIRLRCRLESELEKKRSFYKETEDRAQAAMREVTFFNHMVRSLP